MYNWYFWKKQGMLPKYFIIDEKTIWFPYIVTSVIIIISTSFEINLVFSEKQNNTHQVDNQSAVEYYIGPRHWAGHCREYDVIICYVVLINDCIQWKRMQSRDNT